MAVSRESLMLVVLLVHLLSAVVDMAAHSRTEHGNKDDPHGGVPMGVINSFCDDGVNYTSIDWDPHSSDEYTCSHKVSSIFKTHRQLIHSHCDQQAKAPIHVCYPRAIHYDEDLPTSGRHRPLWPVYGEYTYLPPQRWLHSLEHGSIVFLYDPCADFSDIAKFKAVAKQCLRRHIISPSKRIPSLFKFAVLSWKCKMTMVSPDISKIVEFVRTHALHAPERSVWSDGQYKQGLKEKANVVSTLQESDLCPGFSLMASTADKIKSKSSRRLAKLMDLIDQMKASKELQELLKLQPYN